MNKSTSANTSQAVVESPDIVCISGERLKYVRIKRPIVCNQGNKQYALYLARGSNSYIRVQPIKKSGEISVKPPYWSYDSKWNFVGEAEHCVAYRLNEVPKGAIQRLLFRFFNDATSPTNEWVEQMSLWADNMKLAAGLWAHFEEFRAKAMK